MKKKTQFAQHTIALIVNNKPGVMSKVSGMITRRGFNVDSITVGKTKENDMVRMTLVVRGDDRSIEQIQKQLYKMIDTVRVSAITIEDRVAREMALVKIKLAKGDKSELYQLINLYKGKIIDTSPGGIIVEVTGASSKLDGFIDLLPHNLIVAVARSGVVAMNKLAKAVVD